MSAPRVDALLDRLEGDAGRVAALGAADDVDADPLAPGGQLLDGRGAERVGRAEHDAAVLGDQDPGDLADRGGLAGAVHADHEDDAGLRRRRRVDLEPAVHRRVDQGEQLLAEHRPGVAAVVALDPQPGAQAARPAPGSGPTPTSAVSRVSSIVLPGVLVEPVAREQGEQAAAEPALRAGQPLPQPDQPARGALGPLEGAAPGRLDRSGCRPPAPPPRWAVAR